MEYDASENRNLQGLSEMFRDQLILIKHEIFVQYSSTCGPHTSSSVLPYLDPIGEDSLSQSDRREMSAS